MAWITLSLRKQSLKAEANDLELQDLSLSREKRSIQRNLAYQKSILQAEETSEIKDAKDEYNAVKNKRPTRGKFNGKQYYFKTKTDYEKASAASKEGKTIPTENTNGTEAEYDDAYEIWKQDYSEAKEKYEEQTTNTKDFYDDRKEEVEEEATDKQTQIEEEQTIVETNLQDINQELSSVGDQIGTDIQSSAIKFG